MAEGKAGKYICKKCDVELAMKSVRLDYLGHSVANDFLCCPECGVIYIPEDIASGKMQKLEMTLEDK